MITGSKLIFHDRIESTNNFAAELLKRETPPEGTVVHTNFQSAGKGQQGNKWESEPGKNLLLSIILYPQSIKPDNQFIISMAVSLGIYDFLKTRVRGCRIKWPNDIYVGHDKIAGILIENSIMGDSIKSTIAGIGLNINQLVFPDFTPKAVSLRMITGKNYDLKDCLNNLISNIDRRYRQIYSVHNQKIRNDYISCLYAFMEWRYFLTRKGILHGRITSVADSGLLQVEDELGMNHEFRFKEINFRI
jgi:BirA family transcriptional regulator, biotin operon repressor / biotin---[acetyl-CoA-carboxylase] ligase